MTQIIKTFNNKNLKITVENNELWWCGKDIAEILGYKQPDKAIRDHTMDDERRLIATPQNGRLLCKLKTRCYQINESGLYRLVFSSKLPAAEEFRKWIFKDVLPSIRKTGGYNKTTMTQHNQLCIKSETDLHYEVVKEIRKRFPHLMMVICGGELQDTQSKRIDMWKKGFKGGQPDIIITNPHKDYNGLCIELKNPGGTGVLSDKQKIP